MLFTNLEHYAKRCVDAPSARTDRGRFMKLRKPLMAAVLCAGMLSGCTFLSGGDDLLQTPQPSKNNLLLQKKLDALEGMTEISPQAGQYRNTVTFEDLDGDGVEEAIATVREGTGGSIAVYIFQKKDNDYEQIGHISGQGTAIGELAFPNFSRDGSKKGMIITWTLANGVEQGMTVSGLENGRMEKLAEIEYTNYTITDLDGDGVDELFTLSYGKSSGRKTAQLYDYNGKTVQMISQTDATQDVQVAVHMTTGQLESGETAVFVDNKFENDNGMQTDIYTLRDKSLENLALSANISTYRPLSMYYSDDVDGDGLVEIPQFQAMPGYETVALADTVWMIDWYDFNAGALHRPNRVFTTYHSLNEEWRLILPEKWRGSITVQTEAGTDMNTTRFVNRKTKEVLASVFVYAGADRQNNCSRDGYHLLDMSSTKCYAVKMGDKSNDLAITEARFAQNFAVIQTGWE